MPFYSRTNQYEYDETSRLTKETIGTAAYTYEYDNKGRVTKFAGKTMTYDGRGRLQSCGGTSYTYDNYGNRTAKGGTSYTWTKGRLLSGMGSASYTYDYNGMRYTKRANGVRTRYYYNGTTLLGENRGGKKILYFYDQTGINGFSYDGKTYSFAKDIQGNVTGIFEGMQPLARYVYDAWGNHKVLNPDGTENTSSTFIGNINSIRYRGYYFDTESGLYYLQTRYYDPEIGQFISPDGFKYLDPLSLGGINLYAYCNFNPVKSNKIVNNIINQSVKFQINYQLKNITGTKLNHVGILSGKNTFILHQLSGLILGSIEIGVISMSFQSPKWFNQSDKDDIFNPNAYLAIHKYDIRIEIEDKSYIKLILQLNRRIKAKKGPESEDKKDGE